MSSARWLADYRKTINKAKKRSPVTCIVCNTIWTPIYFSKLDKGQYKTTCTIECTKEYQRQRGQKTFKKLWKNNRDGMCESSSRAGRKSASMITRRSKDEIKLFELCKSYFSNVTSNEIIIDGWDADIVLKNEMIAILWNGPWHYKQMPHNNHSLSQVQNRDRIKSKMLTNAGYKVAIYEDRTYTPEKAFNEIKQIAGSTRR